MVQFVFGDSLGHTGAETEGRESPKAQFCSSASPSKIAHVRTGLKKVESTWMYLLKMCWPTLASTAERGSSRRYMSASEYKALARFTLGRIK